MVDVLPQVWKAHDEVEAVFIRVCGVVLEQSSTVTALGPGGRFGVKMDMMIEVELYSRFIAHVSTLCTGLDWTGPSVWLVVTRYPRNYVIYVVFRFPAHYFLSGRDWMSFFYPRWHLWNRHIYHGSWCWSSVSYLHMEKCRKMCVFCVMILADHALLPLDNDTKHRNGKLISWLHTARTVPAVIVDAWEGLLTLVIGSSYEDSVSKCVVFDLLFMDRYKCMK